ncbi:uncharacterized protein LOC120467733 [Pimephales promelas]|uniref:uncharacterized protein LOC120467733 n=1 Tax=Pimephales promelas TaxID=90988 RepID=UPI0019558899|nr:uncharacterized protein LOC120467733 [Pimephales promelas]
MAFTGVDLFRLQMHNIIPVPDILPQMTRFLRGIMCEYGRLSLFKTQEKKKEAFGTYKHTVLYFAIETLLNQLNTTWTLVLTFKLCLLTPFLQSTTSCLLDYWNPSCLILPARCLPYSAYQPTTCWHPISSIKKERRAPEISRETLHDRDLLNSIITTKENVQTAQKNECGAATVSAAAAVSMVALADSRVDLLPEVICSSLEASSNHTHTEPSALSREMGSYLEISSWISHGETSASDHGAGGSNPNSNTQLPRTTREAERQNDPALSLDPNKSLPLSHDSC